MTRYLHMLSASLVILSLTPFARGQSCYSQSSTAPVFQYSDSGSGSESCYSQTYAVPQSQMQTYSSAPTTYIIVPRSAPTQAMAMRPAAPRYDYGISPNAVYFPEPPQDRLISTTPIPRAPVYQPARPQGRVRTVMVQPTYRQVQVVQQAPQTVYQARQPAFNGLLRGSWGSGCPGGVCR